MFYYFYMDFRRLWWMIQVNVRMSSTNSLLCIFSLMIDFTLSFEFNDEFSKKNKNLINQLSSPDVRMFYLFGFNFSLSLFKLVE